MVLTHYCVIDFYLFDVGNSVVIAIETLLSVGTMIFHYHVRELNREN